MGFNPFAAGGGAGGDYVHNYTTFDDLGIDTHGKTMEEILKEVADMNLPVNTIITGQLYTEAAPDERIYNCEGEIQITQGKYGQVYWCRATSASISPYSWDSIYNQTTDEDNPIDNILPWTPTYYQSTEINEIKKKLEELGADWVGRFERDEDGNILGEYFNDYENNKATGLYSHTEGSMNVNLGETGHVEGYNNQLNSTEKGSHVEGWENIVKGECNHTEGRGNKVYRDNIHVDGISNSTDDITDEKVERNSLGSHMTGVSNKIHGRVQASSVEGVDNTIDGDQSFSSIGIHVEGTTNTVEGNASYSHVEGINNKLDGTATNTHVEGQQNIVRNSVSSHTSGIQNYVEGAVAGYTTGSFNCNKSKEGFVSGYMNSAENKQVAVFGCGNFNNGSNSVIFGGAQDGSNAVYATKTKITSVANGAKSHLRQNKGKNFSFQYSGATLTLEAEITNLLVGSAICIQQLSDSEVIAEFITYVLEKDGKNITVASTINSSEDGLYITKYTAPYGNMNSSGNSLVVGASNRTFNQNQIKNDLIIGLNNDFSGQNTLVQGNSNVINSAIDSFISGNYNWTATPFRSQIFGDSNAVNDFYCSYLQGEQNTVVRTQFSHIEGVSNEIYPNTNGTFINTSGDYVYNVHVEGLNNRIYGNAKGAHVEGVNNVVYEGTRRDQHPHISGYTNFVKDGSFVQGRANVVNSVYSTIIGRHNTNLTGSNNIIIGTTTKDDDDNSSWQYLSTPIKITEISDIGEGWYYITLDSDFPKKSSYGDDAYLVFCSAQRPASIYQVIFNSSSYILILKKVGEKKYITNQSPVERNIYYYKYTGNYIENCVDSVMLGGSNIINSSSETFVLGKKNTFFATERAKKYGSNDKENIIIGFSNNLLRTGERICGNIIVGNGNEIQSNYRSNYIFGQRNSFKAGPICNDGSWGENNYIIGEAAHIETGTNNVIIGTEEANEEINNLNGNYIISASDATSSEVADKQAAVVLELKNKISGEGKSYSVIYFTGGEESDAINQYYWICSIKDETHIYLHNWSYYTPTTTGYFTTEIVEKGDKKINVKKISNFMGMSRISYGINNLIAGQKNFVVGHNERNFVSGYNNALLSGSEGCDIGGRYNTLIDYSNYNFVRGEGNVLKADTHYNSVFGKNVSLNHASNNFIASGAENTQLGKQLNQSINANTILSGANSKIGMRYDGTGATYRGSNTIINGGYHQIDGSFNVCGVGSSDIVSCRNVDFGQDSVIKNKGDNAILCGNANKILSSKYIANDNYDPDDANRLGQYNVVAGQGNTVYASNAYVFGLQNTIGEEPAEDNTTPNANSNRYSLTMGQGNTSLGQGYIVSGFSNNINDATFGLVVGAVNTIDQGCCAVFGTSNTISGNKNSTEGVLVVGSGGNNIANSGNVLLLGSGGNNIAHSQYAYVSGGVNTVNKVHYSIISGGANSVYSADYSYVLGLSNSLGAEDSDLVSTHVFLFGNNLKSSGEQNKIISGAFNAIDAEDKFALVIGNGTADDARSNAFAVSKTGDIYVKNSDTPIDLTPVPMSLLEEICV